jgi:hypothetical protein
MFEQEMAFYCEYVDKKVVRLQAYEMTVLKQEILYMLYEWVRAYLSWMFSDFGFISRWAELPLQHIDEVSYGYYLNDQRSIFSVMRSEED